MIIQRVSAFISSAAVGVLGGLIGLGGAEFRLPILLGLFRFPPLEAVILNKAISLVVVTSGLVFRATVIPWTQIASHWSVVANLLAGSLLGAWVGAAIATRVSSGTLREWIAALLGFIAVTLLVTHDVQGYSSPFLTRNVQFVAGIAAGFGIGVIAAFMGVAGGEFLIPTLILLFGTEVKLAGSLSLAVSLPTMLVGFARYSQDSTFAILGRTKGFVGTMAAGSILGTFVGGRLLGIVSERLLLPLLALILAISAIKTWRHTETKSDSAPIGV